MSELRQLIGIRIRAMRNAKGLTQQKLADIAGLDYRYIGALERGERNFSIDTLEKVLLALNVSLNELMYAKSFSNNDNIRQRTIDNYIALTSTLSDDQISSISKINLEIIRALTKDNMNKF
ncbi:transcriptional regulator [Paenibacillus sp. VT-400]|uniref:helix-turn-helix domain-containing protein n=1 Tax=Paenibacillus sp. VT-400 TaxID=1495853 RepID=UPI00064B5ADC|nr:helix-turn-helix transcriptional regulator [Paenibacillus sp. VT-400]KLU57920.1 transcriptional regulator [Paenibacillus sp. VT-400]